MKKPILFLIDGDHLFYRSLHALIDFSYNGKGTGGFYGFINSLNKMLDEYEVDEMVICWGDKRKNLWRVKKFPEYKGKRTPLEINFNEQWNWITSILENIGVIQLKVATQEADDLIGHIVNKQKENFNILIISGDKDLRQLIEDRSDGWVHVGVEKSGKMTVFNTQKIMDEYGFMPSQLPYFFALTGDKSDNIPGVPGIGPISAKKVILGTASKKIMSKIDNCKELELWESLINLRCTNLDNIVNLIGEPKQNQDLVYKILEETGCTNSLTEKIIEISKRIEKWN